MTQCVLTLVINAGLVFTVKNDGSRETSRGALNHPRIRIKIQSTLVISNSEGLNVILRDIRTSTYQS